MSMTDKDRRTVAPSEMLRDFELILDDRLKQERERRRRAETFGRLAMFAAAASLLATSVMAFALFTGAGPGISPSSLRTGEFHLVDAAGRERGRWAVQQDGTTRLSLLDERGTERMRFTLLDNGAQGITLADSRGEGRVVLSLESGEGSRLTFADAAGRPRTVLGLSAQSAGTLLFADDGGAPRAAMGLEPDGHAMFVLPEERRASSPPADTMAATAGTQGPQ